MFGAIWRRLGRLLGRERLARELDEEIRGHYDELRQAFEDEGQSPADAARLARLRLGGATQILEASADEWRLGALEGAGQDLRLAFRSMGHRPGFAAAALATLALGIGASTAIFSVAYGVSLRPLPYPEPNRLVRIYEANPANGQLEQDVSQGAFHGWREGAPSIEAAALFTKRRSRFLAGANPQPITTMAVSPAFFDVLAVRPMLGPGFKPEHEYTRFTARDAVLSFAAWHRIFGGDHGVIGRSILFVDDDDPFRVVGVMPEGFAFTEPVDIWQPKIVEVPVARILRNWRYDRVVARLRSGSMIGQARAELEGVAARLARDFPASHGGWTVTVRSLHDSVIGNFGRATWMLLAAVAVVLLVTCLNVGGLLVARAVARERETAVRAALGAGSWRLLRLWLAEAWLLSASGAGLGLLFAWSGVSALKAAAPPGIPRLEDVALDLPALAVAALATLFAVVIFTMAPIRAGRMSRRDLLDGLRTGSAGAGDGPGRQRTRSTLTAAQCAGAAALVILAVMLTRSFVRLTSFDLGWDPDGVLSMTVSPPMPPELRRPWYRYVEWSDRLIAALEAKPGIQRAAITTQIPLAPEPYPTTLARGRGKTASDDTRWPGVGHHVTDGYFDLMGIRLVGGRTFGPGDRFSESQLNYRFQAGRGVVVVSESAARVLWPDRPAVGEALWLPNIDNVEWREVVGVVEDIQFHGVGEAPALHVFVPWTQFTTGRPRLVVKSAHTSGASIAALMRDVVQRVEPGTRIDQVASLDALVSRATAQPRFTSRTVSAFGALALLLAAVGIYGTLSYLVGARTREIGIRLALGAPRSAIMSNVLSRGLVPAIAGGAGGLAIAMALARTFRALLFEVEPLDVSSFAGGATLLVLVALAAALGPALRASRIDPVRALRIE
jgi:putative ABC transport system permease protein